VNLPQELLLEGVKDPLSIEKMRLAVIADNKEKAAK
jgi:hypothetical protein